MIDRKNRIYLDYQASTPVDPLVLEDMMPFFRDSFGNPHASEHIFGWESMKAIDNARRMVANAINADHEEVIFTSGATESNNLAILGVVKANMTQRKKILVSSIEHKCVLNAASSLIKDGYEIVQLPVNSEGILELNTLKNYLDENVLLVSVMAVNNEIGTIEPIHALSELIHAGGALFHTDAAQALPATQIDVAADNIDFLSLSSHKIYGPKGIGALFISRTVREHIQPIMYGGGQEDGLRSGTLPTPLCVGFGKAAELMKINYAQEAFHLRGLRDKLFESIKEAIPDVQINGPPLNKRHPGNLNLRFPSQDAKSLLQMLQPNIAASTGSACTSGIEEPSYVLREIGLTKEEAQSSIRFSVGRFTTERDIDQAVEVLRNKCLVF